MNELILSSNIPVEVDPTTVGSSGVTMVIQNTMPSQDDILFVSKDGTPNPRTWMKVFSGDSVKFATKVWLVQPHRRQWIFPVYEIS
jgi:hypothetical protein